MVAHGAGSEGGEESQFFPQPSIPIGTRPRGRPDGQFKVPNFQYFFGRLIYCGSRRSK